MKVISLKEWKEKATELFGEDTKQWEFRCPMCKEVQKLQDFIDHEIDEPLNKFYFSCIGRYVEDRGCDWTLGGLFRIHETEVEAEDEEKTRIPVMEFATQNEDK